MYSLIECREEKVEVCIYLQFQNHFPFKEAIQREKFTLGQYPNKSAHPSPLYNFLNVKNYVEAHIIESSLDDDGDEKGYHDDDYDVKFNTTILAAITW